MQTAPEHARESDARKLPDFTETRRSRRFRQSWAARSDGATAGHAGGRQPAQLAALSVPFPGLLGEVLFELPFHAIELLGFRKRILLDGDVGPQFRVAGVDFQPVFEIWLGVGQDRFRRAFGLAHTAVDTLVGVDHEHVLTLIEAIDRTHLDAIRMLALDAVVGNEIRHLDVHTSFRAEPRGRPLILAPFRAEGMKAQPAPPRTRIRSPFLRVLAGEVLDPPPVWLMRQAGRYLPEYRQLRKHAGSFLNLCLTPELAAEATLQPIRRFGFDAAILFADILLIPHALGQQVEYVEGKGPRLDALTSPEDIDRLHPEERVDEVLSSVFATISFVRSRLPLETAVIGFAGAPWTVATYMIGGGRGLDQALHWVREDPAGYDMLSRILEAATVRYLCAQVAAGADALQLFDSWAGTLPDDTFRQFSVQATRRIVEGVREFHPAIPIIGFPRGASCNGYLEYARETGIDVIALDQSASANWAARVLQPLLPVQGNLDPALLSPGQRGLVEEASRIRRIFRNGPHVFNLGHGIRPDADPGRVELLVSTLRQEDTEDRK